jgi:hypothetical protein
MAEASVPWAVASGSTKARDLSKMNHIFSATSIPKGQLIAAPPLHARKSGESRNLIVGTSIIGFQQSTQLHPSHPQLQPHHQHHHSNLKIFNNKILGSVNSQS